MYCAFRRYNFIFMIPNQYVFEYLITYYLIHSGLVIIDFFFFLSVYLLLQIYFLTLISPFFTCSIPNYILGYVLISTVGIFLSNFSYFFNFLQTRFLLEAYSLKVQIRVGFRLDIAVY